MHSGCGFVLADSGYLSLSLRLKCPIMPTHPAPSVDSRLPSSARSWTRLFLATRPNVCSRERLGSLRQSVHPQQPSDPPVRWNCTPRCPITSRASSRSSCHRSPGRWGAFNAPRLWPKSSVPVAHGGRPGGGPPSVLVSLGPRPTGVRAPGGVIPYPGPEACYRLLLQLASRSPVDHWQNLGDKSFQLVGLVSNRPDEDPLGTCRSEGLELFREPLGRADR